MFTIRWVLVDSMILCGIGDNLMQSYDVVVIMNMSRGETETSTIPKAVSLDTHHKTKMRCVVIKLNDDKQSNPFYNEYMRDKHPKLTRNHL